MKTPDAAFITDLYDSAIAAQRDEIGFRESIAAELARRERARQFAFRRLDLARTMAAAAEGAEDEADAVARQLSAFKRELEWNTETDQRTRTLDAWRPVAQAVWRSLPQPVGAGDATAEAAAPQTAREVAAADAVRQALLTFEIWYEAEHKSPFLMMFEQVIEDMPVVEF